jgi:hypothetical protein
MDPERWADAVRDFVEALTNCGRCAAPRKEALLVTVEYQPPMWLITARCMRCGSGFTWHLVGPQPKPALTPDGIKEPDWYREVRSRS